MSIIERRIKVGVMKKVFPKTVLVLAFALAAYLAYHFGLFEFLDLEYLKTNQEKFQEFYRENRSVALGGFFILYVLATALSLPGAAVLTLAAGALFGFWTALALVSFASSLGATIAFLSSRYLLRDFVRSKFKKQIQAIDSGISKDGAFYLFSLRLIPIFPFFAINLAMGLTSISTLIFYGVSQLGMLPGTAVYVNAGLQLSQIESLKSILSFELIFSFALLGIFPLFSRKIIELIKKRRVYKGHHRPKKFDYNLAVIGAGSGGLVSAYIAALVKSKVALIEKGKMGGDCLNTGCVPSKTLIKSAKVAHLVGEAKRFGVYAERPSVNFLEIMERVRSVIKQIEPNDSVERYEKLGVNCLSGSAKFVSPWELEVGEKKISAKNIIVATGARPFLPPIEGLQEIDYLTSENIWNLNELPKRLLVLGGGAIGCELSQAFQRLGSQVTIVERADQLLAKEDSEVGELLLKIFKSEGMQVHLGSTAKSFSNENGKKVLTYETKGQLGHIEFDQVLVALGRKANTKGLGLEDLGVRLRPDGTIETNEYLETNFPHIFSCGDATGPFQLTQAASHQAWYASVNALFGAFKKFKTDYRILPYSIYTDPEVARVGANEREALEEGLDYEVTTYEFSESDRALADGRSEGFIKVLTEKGKDKILGATIIGERASETLLEHVSAMKHGKGLQSILGTVHAYPTIGEANKFLAGNWKKARQPEWAFKYLKKYHAWRRS